MNLLSISLAILCSVSLLGKNESSQTCAPIEPTVILLSEGERTPITVEEYVVGVVANEMPHTFSKEALKSQAVAARTYLYYCLENNSHPHENADVCTDHSHCCGFITEAQLIERYGTEQAALAINAAREAAYATEGEVLMYENAPILALWHSSSKDTTEDCGAVFVSSLPYLVSVSTSEAAETRTVSFSIGDVGKLLGSAGHRYDRTAKASVTRNSAGRCEALTIGNVTLDGRSARTLFGLRSTDFTAQFIGGRLYFFVSGYGHGVGLSQYGADQMAKDGAEYGEIVRHYYTGAEIGQVR